jgi:hypothetical protein
MRWLFARRRSERELMELHLVGMAAEVAAAAASARKALADLGQDASERRQLLEECLSLEEAAADLLDPRSQFLESTSAEIGHLLDSFLDHQHNSGLLRSAALKLARKRA